MGCPEGRRGLEGADKALGLAPVLCPSVLSWRLASILGRRRPGVAGVPACRSRRSVCNLWAWALPLAAPHGAGSSGLWRHWYPGPSTPAASGSQSAKWACEGEAGPSHHSRQQPQPRPHLSPHEQPRLPSSLPAWRVRVWEAQAIPGKSAFSVSNKLKLQPGRAGRAACSRRRLPGWFSQSARPGLPAGPPTPDPRSPPGSSLLAFPSFPSPSSSEPDPRGREADRLPAPPCGPRSRRVCSAPCSESETRSQTRRRIEAREPSFPLRLCGLGHWMLALPVLSLRLVPNIQA